MHLKHIGKYYSGFEGTRHILANAGDIVEVSGAKAAQLLADYPQDWVEIADDKAAAEIKGRRDGELKASEEVNKAEQEKDEAKAAEHKKKAEKKKKDALGLNKTNR